MYEASFLDQLINIAKENAIITITDEVMTGFGRTGRFFASDYLSQAPDIFCLSKGLTGGYLPLGVTSCAEFIYEAYLSNDKTKTFFHGHSYTGNATACSAALASLDLLEKPKCWEQIKMIEAEHLKFREKVLNVNSLKDVRVFGTIIAFELKSDDKLNYLNPLSEKITKYFTENKIIIRPLGNVFYLIPPYVITQKELFFIYDKIELFLSKFLDSI